MDLAGYHPINELPRERLRVFVLTRDLLEMQEWADKVDRAEAVAWRPVNGAEAGAVENWCKVEVEMTCKDLRDVNGKDMGRVYWRKLRYGLPREGTEIVVEMGDGRRIETVVCYDRAVSGYYLSGVADIGNVAAWRYKAEPGQSERIERRLGDASAMACPGDRAESEILGG